MPLIIEFGGESFQRRGSLIRLRFRLSSPAPHMVVADPAQRMTARDPGGSDGTRTRRHCVIVHRSGVFPTAVGRRAIEQRRKAARPGAIFAYGKQPDLVIALGTASTVAATVALKVGPAGIAPDSERLGHFRPVAKALAQVDHPSIVTIYSRAVSGRLDANRATSQQGKLRERARIRAQ